MLPAKRVWCPLRGRDNSDNGGTAVRGDVDIDLQPNSIISTRKPLTHHLASWIALQAKTKKSNLPKVLIGEGLRSVLLLGVEIKRRKELKRKSSIWLLSAVWILFYLRRI